jgi:hypothetical protein
MPPLLMGTTSGRSLLLITCSVSITPMESGFDLPDESIHGSWRRALVALDETPHS